VLFDVLMNFNAIALPAFLSPFGLRVGPLLESTCWGRFFGVVRHSIPWGPKTVKPKTITSSNRVVTDSARVVTRPESPPISLHEAARRLDVNLSAVQKRIRAGTLSTLPGGKLDWAVQREWIAHRNASQVRKA
jgi:hypothetical protein